MSCDYGAEQYVVPGGTIMVRTVGWMSRRSCDLLTAESHILREVRYSEKSLVRREVTGFEIDGFAAGGGADCAKGGDHRGEYPIGRRVQRRLATNRR